MKDKLLAEIQKCETRLETLRELLHDFGGAPAKKKLGRPRKVVEDPPALALKGKRGPKPKVKPAKAVKAAKPDKPKKQPKKGGKLPRLVYPGVDVVLAALSSEPKGIAAIVAETKFEQKLVSPVVKKLVEDGKVSQDGGGRWTTYKLA